MPKVTSSTKQLLEDLLGWDRERIEQHRSRGFDVQVYILRQNAAHAMLDFPVENWPEEVRELFQAVLEVTRNPMVPALQLGIGELPSSARRSIQTPAEIRAYKNAATEIGVIDRLRAVGPTHWS